MTVVCGVRVTLLDGFGIHGGTGVPPTAVGEIPRGVQRLVAHLCLSRRASRSATAGLLWPEVSEEHAHASLRSALWRLHKVVPDLVQVSGHSLSLAPGARVDVRELDEWARRVDDPRSCLDDLAPSHVGLGEELLPGWYDDWVLLERERLRQLRMHALESVAGRLASAGRHGQALQAAYAAVRAEPLRESAHRTVVRVHLAEGNVAEALRAHDHYRVLVWREMGVQPSEQMARLVAGLDHARRPVALRTVVG